MRHPLTRGLQSLRSNLCTARNRKRYAQELRVSVALDTWWAPFIGTWHRQIRRTVVRDKGAWLALRLFETDPEVTEYAGRMALSDGDLFSDADYDEAIRDAWRRSFEPKRRPLTCFQVWRMRAHHRAALMLEGEIL
jgi:hypothetical protein